jgi:hypothetical protein
VGAVSLGPRALLGQAAEADGELGLDLQWLPLESRTSLTEFAGRNLPRADLDSNGALIVGGGRPGDTALLIDGFRVRRLTLPLGSVDHLHLTTGGYGAALADVAGGVLAVETRSGSPHTHAEAGAFHDRRDIRRTALTGALSGPAVGDRLFYAASFQGELAGERDASDIEGILPVIPGRRRRTWGGALKVSWLPDDRNRIDALGLADRTRADYGGVLGTEPEAQPAWTDQHLLGAVRWTGRLTEAVTARAHVRFEGTDAEERPRLCDDDPSCELVPATLQSYPRRQVIGNHPNHDERRTSGWEVTGQVELQLPARPWLLRVASRLETEAATLRHHTPGDVVDEFKGPDPDARTITFANDPRLGPAALGWSSFGVSSLRTVHAVEGEARLPARVTVVPGLALVTSALSSDGTTLHALAVTPHAGLTWDVTGKGRTWVHASVHRRADADLATLAGVDQWAPVSSRCKWNEQTRAFSKDCVFSGGHNWTVGLPCSPLAIDGDGRPCSQTPRLASAWEETLGVAQDLPAGFRLAVDLVHRRASDLPTPSETNRLWNASGTDVTGYRDARSRIVLDATPRSDFHVRYVGVTASVEKQSGASRLLAAYTYSRHEGDQFFAAYGGGVVSGDLPDDRRHSIRVLARRELGSHASLGLVYSYDSGLPILRLLRGTSSASWENYRAATGVNPGANIKDLSDDRPTRYPGLQRLNLQARLRVPRVAGVAAEVYADIINIADFGLFGPEDLTSFAPPLRYQEARSVRLGIELRH